ncbi:hypothetical protein SK128_025028 [Halocaridina rubra]|uniref:Uncharacterized protein n=1 Tax=Halocaridina rubra TaxID=373956 RepID=A0AAN8WHU9_HALRR
MKFSLILISVLASVAVTIAFPLDVARKSELHNAFENRATIEDIIDCFLNKKPCSSQEQKIKERALATMRNFGVCPSDVCTREDREEITEAMELLQRKHPDLWARLVASMFGIDIKGN